MENSQICVSKQHSPEQSKAQRINQRGKKYLGKNENGIQHTKTYRMQQKQLPEGNFIREKCPH